MPSGATGQKKKEKKKNTKLRVRFWSFVHLVCICQISLVFLMHFEAFYLQVIHAVTHPLALGVIIEICSPGSYMLTFSKSVPGLIS